MLFVKMPTKHRNPPLKKGCAYQLIEDAGSVCEYRAGSVFVVGYEQIVWLVNDKGSNGGHDSISHVAVDRNFKFVEVDLTLA